MILIGQKFNIITNNVFCLSHPKNAFNNRQNFSSGKTNILNESNCSEHSIYEKIYIYS